MPKDIALELGPDSGDITCCLKGCKRKVALDTSSWNLPFCRGHLALLPRALFRKLCKAASRSVYDLDAVADATQLVADARRILKEAKGGKR